MAQGGGGAPSLQAFRRHGDVALRDVGSGLMGVGQQLVILVVFSNPNGSVALWNASVALIIFQTSECQGRLRSILPWGDGVTGPWERCHSTEPPLWLLCYACSVPALSLDGNRGALPVAQGTTRQNKPWDSLCARWVCGGR